MLLLNLQTLLCAPSEVVECWGWGGCDVIHLCLDLSGAVVGAPQ